MGYHDDMARQRKTREEAEAEADEFFMREDRKMRMRTTALAWFTALASIPGARAAYGATEIWLAAIFTVLCVVMTTIGVYYFTEYMNIRGKLAKIERAKKRAAMIALAMKATETDND